MWTSIPWIKELYPTGNVKITYILSRRTTFDFRHMTILFIYWFKILNSPLCCMWQLFRVVWVLPKRCACRSWCTTLKRRCSSVCRCRGTTSTARRTTRPTRHYVATWTPSTGRTPPSGTSFRRTPTTACTTWAAAKNMSTTYVFHLIT